MIYLNNGDWQSKIKKYLNYLYEENVNEENLFVFFNWG